MKIILYVLIVLSVTLYANDTEGKKLYSKCSGCHGQKGETKALGKSNILAGQSVFALINKLRAYRKGERNNTGMGALMKGQAYSLTDAQLVKVALYMAGLNPIKKKINKDEISTIMLKSDGAVFTVYYHQYAQRGKDFILRVKLTNGYGIKTMGGISISFPNEKEFKGDVVSKIFERITQYSSPEKVYNKISKKSKKLEYALLEGWEHDWTSESKRYIKLKLHFPKDAKSMPINLRAILIEKNKREILMPRKSTELDQQGYPVKQIVVHAID